MKKLLLFLILIAFKSISYSQTTEIPFSRDIEGFNKLDSLTPPQKNAVLFIGSSSFTMWYDLQQNFPDVPLINRAFGGSQLTDVIYWIQDIVYPYDPKQVVVYCGENDFAHDESLSPESVSQRFIQLFTLIRSRYPDCKISYVSMKPSPSRWHLASSFLAANNIIRHYLQHQNHASYIDVWNSMLNEKQLPDSTIFLNDWLHMNATGYQIWKNKIEPELIK